MDKEDTISVIRSLLISRNEAYDLSLLIKDFKEEAGCDIPLFGYKTLIDFLKSIPDNVKVITSHNRVQLLPVHSSKSAHISSLVKRQEALKRKKTQAIKCSIFNNNVRHESSIIDVRRHESVIKNKIQSPTNYTFSCESLTNKKEGSNTIEVKNTMVQRTRNYSTHKSVNEVRIESFGNRDEIILYKHDIPELDLRSYLGTAKYVEVCVSEVWNPDKFTLQLRQFKHRLINLMSQLQSFYSENGDNYLISQSDLEVSHLCAAFCKTNNKCSEWYRAMILKINDNIATTLLLDYGTIATVEISNLRYLKKQFGLLPLQAFYGSLANIQPCEGKYWPEETSKRLLNFVFEKDLIAGVVDIDYEVKWCSVALSITGDVDIHINDTLVEENLAVFNDRNTSYTVKETDPLSLNDLQMHIRPEDIGKSRKLRSLKENFLRYNVEVLSYSENNDRLQEMFIAA